MAADCRDQRPSHKACRESSYGLTFRSNESGVPLASFSKTFNNEKLTIIISSYYLIALYDNIPQKKLQVAFSTYTLIYHTFQFKNIMCVKLY
jgi:hypothetical protein